MLGGVVGPVAGPEVLELLGGVVGPVTGAEVLGVPAGEDAAELVEELQAVNSTATHAREAQDATRRDLRALPYLAASGGGAHLAASGGGRDLHDVQPSINE